MVEGEGGARGFPRGGRRGGYRPPNADIGGRLVGYCGPPPRHVPRSGIGQLRLGRDGAHARLSRSLKLHTAIRTLPRVSLAPVGRPAPWLRLPAQFPALLSPVCFPRRPRLLFPISALSSIGSISVFSLAVPPTYCLIILNWNPGVIQPWRNGAGVSRTPIETQSGAADPSRILVFVDAVPSPTVRSRIHGRSQSR